MKYRENVLKEAKEQIKDKKRILRPQKFDKEKYEQEIASIKQLYENKNMKLIMTLKI